LELFFFFFTFNLDKFQIVNIYTILIVSSMCCNPQCTWLPFLCCQCVCFHLCCRCWFYLLLCCIDFSMCCNIYVWLCCVSCFDGWYGSFYLSCTNCCLFYCMDCCLFYCMDCCFFYSRNGCFFYSRNGCLFYSRNGCLYYRRISLFNRWNYCFCYTGNGCLWLIEGKRVLIVQLHKFE
jgi:hypothetical protein